MRLWRTLLQPAREAAIWASAGGVATVLAGVGLMATSAYLISRAALRPPTLLLLLAPIAGVRFFAVLRAASRYGERVMTHDAAFRSLAELRVAIFDRWVARPPVELLGGARGDWLRRLSGDVDRLIRLYADGIGPFVGLVFVAGAVGLFVASFDGWAGVVAASLLVATGAAMPVALGQAQANRRDTVVRAESRLSARVVDLLEGLGDLLAGGHADTALAATLQVNHESLDRQRRLERLGGWLESLVVIGSESTAFIVLLMTLPAVRDHRLPGYLLATLVLASVAAFEVVRPLTSSVPFLGEVKAAARRIWSDESPSVRRGSARPLNGSITVEGLGVRYASDRPMVMQRVSFGLEDGQHGVIVGSSGEGKSTMGAVLARLAPYQEGRVRLGGVDLEDLDEQALRDEVGCLLQRPHLFRTSLAQNMRLARPLAEDRQIWAALHAVGLGDWAERLPQQLDTGVGEMGHQLSGGERRRVALAQIFLRDPPIWILDEPLADLDSGTADLVAAAIANATRHRTLLLLTHEPMPAVRVDKVWRLQGGRLEAVRTDPAAL